MESGTFIDGINYMVSADIIYKKGYQLIFLKGHIIKPGNLPSIFNITTLVINQRMKTQKQK